MVAAAFQSSNKPGWLRPAGTIAGIYIFPVVLLATGARVSFEWRFHVLIVMTLLAVALALSRHSVVSLGLALPRFRSLMAWSVLPSAIIIATYFLTDRTHRHFTAGHIPFYVFFVLVSAPAQEFLYRSFLFAELRAIQIPPAGIILLSALLFGFMHIIYKDPATVLLTLTAGLVWALVFSKTRKVCIVAFSHAALGVAAIFAGVV